MTLRAVTRVALGVVLSCALSCALTAWASATDAAEPLARLLARLSQVTALSAHFREEKRMALLSVPLISEGELYYEKPRSLVRHTRTPIASSLLLQGSTLSFGDAKQVTTLSLSAHAGAGVLVDALVGVLSGDRAALEQAAALRAEVRQDGTFRIVATPRRDPLRKLVRALEFNGTGAMLQRMRLVDASGDETIMTFSEVRVRTSFDARERARLFRIGG